METAAAVSAGTACAAPGARCAGRAGFGFRAERLLQRIHFGAQPREFLTHRGDFLRHARAAAAAARRTRRFARRLMRGCAA